MRAPIVLSLLLAALLAGPARAQDNAVSAPGWQPTPWADSVFLESQLFFSLNTPDGRGVSEQQWVQFVAEIVAPRFPGGLTVLEAQGLAAAPAPSPTPAAAASGGASTTATPASATPATAVPTSGAPTSAAPTAPATPQAGNGTSASTGPAAGSASTTATAPDPAPGALSAAAALALSRPGTRLLLIVHPNTPDASAKLGEIKAAYIQRFGQRRVFHVDFPVRVNP